MGHFHITQPIWSDSTKYEVYKYDTYKYMDSLQALVQAYNESYHSSLKQSPASIGKHNEVYAFVQQ